MGNNQTALSGIHPFKDPSDYSTQVVVTPPQSQSARVVVADEVLVAPTPPPRRGIARLKLSKLLKMSTLSRSLKSLPKMLSRPDLNKLGSLLRFRKKYTFDREFYTIPPDAERPSPPSKPEVFHEQDEYFLVRWDPPAYDGGVPIIGYVLQHLELGLPELEENAYGDETESWYSSEPGQVTSTEVLLNNLIPGTTYQFRVIGENLLGYSSPGEISNPIVYNPNGELDDWFCAPTIITSLETCYTVLESERLTLTIELTGQPYPIVKWYDREDNEIKAKQNKYVITSYSINRTLTFLNACLADAGPIKCIAENEKGAIIINSLINVQAPPLVERVTPGESRVDLTDLDSIFHAGEQAKLRFRIYGAPTPNMCVYHEADLVLGSEPGGTTASHARVHVEMQEKFVIVRVDNMNRSDRGEWTIRADNHLGEDSATVLITVTDRPSSPGRPDVLQLSDNTCILKWDKPYDDGGCPLQSYVVEYYRSEWGVWLKASTNKMPYTKIRDLIPGSKYKFRVKAENLYGVSDPSPESVELLITDLHSTLRSVNDGDTPLLMKTVLEEDEMDEGHARVSISTMTDLTIKHAVPAVDQPKLLQVAFQPQVLIMSEDQPDNDSYPVRDRYDFFNHDYDHVFQTIDSHSPRISPSFQAEFVDPFMDVPTYLSNSPQLTSPGQQEFRPISPAPLFRGQHPPDLGASPRPQSSPVPSPRLELSPGDQINRSSPHRPQASISPSANQMRSVSPRPQAPTSIAPPTAPQRTSSPRPHVGLIAPPRPNMPAPSGAPAQRPVSPRPPQQPTKVLYSRSDIIRSAAATTIDYSYSVEGEDEEQDAELEQVKKVLAAEDEDEDEEPYEYDFEKLQAEYEEDKKRGIVSRQDSGVSNKSFSRDESIEISVMSDTDEHEGLVRACSVQSEVIGSKPPSGRDFQRAQSEVTHTDSWSHQIVNREFNDRVPVEYFGAAKAVEPEPAVEPHYEPQVEPEVESPETYPAAESVAHQRQEPEPEAESAAESDSAAYRRDESTRPRRESESALDSRLFRPPQRRESEPGRGDRSVSQPRVMLHDRFTDYIAMKASSRNKAIGSSLRSLRSYDSQESVTSAGGRKTGTVKSSRKFEHRAFDRDSEVRDVKKLEKSTSSMRSMTLGYDLIHPLQSRGGGNRFNSQPHVMSSSNQTPHNNFLSHSQSEYKINSYDIPDSLLKNQHQDSHYDYSDDFSNSSAVDRDTPNDRLFNYQPKYDDQVSDAESSLHASAPPHHVHAGEVDAGDVDAGEVDAGEVDAGEVDADEVDADEVDAGEVDAGEVDAGEVDADEVDAGEVDAGEVDAGEVDAEEFARLEAAFSSVPIGNVLMPADVPEEVAVAEAAEEVPMPEDAPEYDAAAEEVLLRDYAAEQTVPIADNWVSIDKVTAAEEVAEVEEVLGAAVEKHQMPALESTEEASTETHKGPIDEVTAAEDVPTPECSAADEAVIEDESSPAAEGVAEAEGWPMEAATVEEVTATEAGVDGEEGPKVEEIPVVEEEVPREEAAAEDVHVAAAEEIPTPEAAVEDVPTVEEIIAPEETAEEVHVSKEIETPELAAEDVPEQTTSPEGAVEDAPVAEQIVAPEAVVEVVPVDEEIIAPEAVEEVPTVEDVVTDVQAAEEVPAKEDGAIEIPAEEVPVNGPIETPAQDAPKAGEALQESEEQRDLNKEAGHASQRSGNDDTDVDVDDFQDEDAQEEMPLDEGELVEREYVEGEEGEYVEELVQGEYVEGEYEEREYEEGEYEEGEYVEGELIEGEYVEGEFDEDGNYVGGHYVDGEFVEGEYDGEEGEYEEGDYEDGEYEQELPAVNPIDVDSFKYKSLDAMCDIEFSEKNSHIEDLLSKLDKFLLDNDDEEQGTSAPKGEEPGDAGESGVEQETGEGVISPNNEAVLDVQAPEDCSKEPGEYADELETESATEQKATPGEEVDDPSVCDQEAGESLNEQVAEDQENVTEDQQVSGNIEERESLNEPKVEPAEIPHDAENHEPVPQVPGPGESATKPESLNNEPVPTDDAPALDPGETATVPQTTPEINSQEIANEEITEETGESVKQPTAEDSLNHEETAPGESTQQPENSSDQKPTEESVQDSSKHQETAPEESNSAQEVTRCESTIETAPGESTTQEAAKITKDQETGESANYQTKSELNEPNKEAQTTKDNASISQLDDQNLASEPQDQTPVDQQKPPVLTGYRPTMSAYYERKSTTPTPRASRESLSLQSFSEDFKQPYARYRSMKQSLDSLNSTQSLAQPEQKPIIVPDQPEPVQEPVPSEPLPQPPEPQKPTKPDPPATPRMKSSLFLLSDLVKSPPQDRSDRPRSTTPFDTDRTNMESPVESRLNQPRPGTPLEQPDFEEEPESGFSREGTPTPLEQMESRMTLEQEPADTTPEDPISEVMSPPETGKLSDVETPDIRPSDSETDKTPADATNVKTPDSEAITVPETKIRVSPEPSKQQEVIKMLETLKLPDLIIQLDAEPDSESPTSGEPSEPAKSEDPTDDTKPRGGSLQPDRIRLSAFQRDYLRLRNKEPYEKVKSPLQDLIQGSLRAKARKQSDAPLKEQTPLPEELAPEQPKEPSRKISKVMTYVFSITFYLMLTPILCVIEQWELALICIFVIACIHMYMLK